MVKREGKMSESWLTRRAREAAEKAALRICDNGLMRESPEFIDETSGIVADAIAELAREFAERALRSIYEVDSQDERDERARGGYRVRHAFAGTGNIERRHYRQDFNRMIAEAIEAAEKENP
jgi:hypothetical protein